jgi:hypothetical protein
VEFRLPVVWNGFVDLNGKAPLVDSSAVWARSSGSSGSSDRQRTVERHRHRRRTRLPSATRARIRFRIWLACMGALVVMALGVYLMLGGHQGG